MWITNTLTGCIVGLSVAIRLNYVSVQALKLSYYAIQKRHEYYRLFTCLICWDHLSMGVLFQTYVFWQFSSSFESSVYNKKPMQYLFGIFVLAVSILSQGFMFKEARYPLLADIFTNGLSTWWSRVARDSPVSFYGLTLKAGYLPFAGLCIQFLYNGELAAKRCFLGILAGLTSHVFLTSRMTGGI